MLSLTVKSHSIRSFPVNAYKPDARNPLLQRHMHLGSSRSLWRSRSTLPLPVPHAPSVTGTAARRTSLGTPPSIAWQMGRPSGPTHTKATTHNGLVVVRSLRGAPGASSRGQRMATGPSSPDTAHLSPRRAARLLAACWPRGTSLARRPPGARRACAEAADAEQSRAPPLHGWACAARRAWASNARPRRQQPIRKPHPAGAAHPHHLPLPGGERAGGLKSPYE
eukprot:scaffold866_cov544-Prasinococcus_capsulatus_cf.AAC.8